MDEVLLGLVRNSVYKSLSLVHIVSDRIQILHVKSGTGWWWLAQEWVSNYQMPLVRNRVRV